MSKERKKNIVIMAAMIAVLVMGSISAYFTATDSAVNTFTVGSVEIEQIEPEWDNGDPDHPQGDKYTDDDGDGVPDSQQITPNHEFNKDPKVVNKGENDAYVYTMVAIPKKQVRVAVTSTGDTALQSGVPAAGTNLNNYANQDTQLFQMNKTRNGSGETSAAQMQNIENGKASKSGAGISQPVTTANAGNDARSWTGVDTFNDSWYLLKVNPAEAGSALAAYQEHYNIYLFAYADSDGANSGVKATLTKLPGRRNGAAGGNAAGATTPELFQSVTVANMVNINDLLGTNDEDNIDYDANIEGTMPQILVKSFAIQCDNLTDADTADAGEVWDILNNQDGAYLAMADELHDLDAADSAWQTAGVDHADRTEN